MPVRLLPPEEREQGHQRFVQQLGPQPRVRLANVTQAVLLDDPLMFPFRGWLYHVREVSVPDGLVISELVDLIEESATATSAQRREVWTTVYSRAVPMLKRLMRPRGMPRVLWFVWANPFLRATEREIATLLHFLSLCRMRDSIRR